MLQKLAKAIWSLRFVYKGAGSLIRADSVLPVNSGWLDDLGNSVQRKILPKPKLRWCTRTGHQDKAKSSIWKRVAPMRGTRPSRQIFNFWEMRICNHRMVQHITSLGKYLSVAVGIYSDCWPIHVLPPPIQHFVEVSNVFLPVTWRRTIVYLHALQICTSKCLNALCPFAWTAAVVKVWSSKHPCSTCAAFPSKISSCTSRNLSEQLKPQLLPHLEWTLQAFVVEPLCCSHTKLIGMKNEHFAWQTPQSQSTKTSLVCVTYIFEGAEAPSISWDCLGMWQRVSSLNVCSCFQRRKSGWKHDLCRAEKHPSWLLALFCAIMFLVWFDNGMFASNGVTGCSKHCAEPVGFPTAQVRRFESL